MKRLNARLTPEVIVLLALLAGSILALIFMPALVAKPKLLFGRALTAISPSLFPKIILAAEVILCAGALWRLRTAEAREVEAGLNRREWLRGIALVAILTGYALTMEPFGFLISSAIATALISIEMGNRSVIQTVLVSVLGPVLLYLAATRLLAVSLPELNVIELFYAHLL